MCVESSTTSENMYKKRKIICIATAIQATKYFIQSIIEDQCESDSSDKEVELLSIVGDGAFINPLNIRNKIPRMDNYFEIVLPSYTNQQFQSLSDYKDLHLIIYVQE